MKSHEQYLLDQLAEECVELAHICHKASRFGLDEVYDSPANPDKLSNKKRLLLEFADLVAVSDMLESRGYFELSDDDIKTLPDIDKLVGNKQIKVIKFMKYSASLGRVEPVPDNF